MHDCKCEVCVKENETKISNAIDLLRETIKERKISNLNFSRLLVEMNEYIVSDDFACEDNEHHTMIKLLINSIKSGEIFHNPMKSRYDMDRFIETIRTKEKELNFLRENNLKLKEEIKNLLEEIHNGSDTHIRNEELKELKNSNIAYQNKIKSLIQDKNEMYFANSTMMLSNTDKDNVIGKLEREVDNLKYNAQISVEKRNNADRQYEKKYKEYDSKIKELDEKIVSLKNELTHERNYKEILITNIEKCFKGYKEQLNFLDLYKKNSLYFLEELNKFTTNIQVKVDIS